MAETTEKVRLMTTYTHRDGGDFGEYTFETEWAGVENDAECHEEPTAYVEEVWALVGTSVIELFPPAYGSCEVEDQEECENDAHGWWKSPDGTWMHACREHGGVPTYDLNMEAKGDR